MAGLQDRGIATLVPVSCFSSGDKWNFCGRGNEASIPRSSLSLSLSLNLVGGLLLVKSQGTLTFTVVRENAWYLSNKNNNSQLRLILEAKVAKE